MTTVKHSGTLPRPPADRNGKAAILFVDDEERILRSLRMLFGQQYRVLVTTSGLEALEILKSERIHVLVSDQRMPIMPGVELLRRAREVSPDTLRLLLTGYSDMEAVTGSINEGEVFRFIHKPWNAEEIRATVGLAVTIAQQLETVVSTPAAPIQTVGRERILVMDDDAGTAQQIRELLSEQGEQAEVHWANDVDQVFQILESGPLAVVVADVRLKGEDVTELIASLKRHQPQVVTLALTAFEDSNLLTQLINQAQIFRFMLKPLRPRVAERGILAALERHRSFQARPELILRHQVEEPTAPQAELEPDTVTGSNENLRDAPPVRRTAASRILGFFRNFNGGAAQA